MKAIPDNEVPRIEISKEIILIGMKVRMSFAQDKTFELWSHFSPKRNQIQNISDQDLYSIDIYDSITFFDALNPNAIFDKYAAVKVDGVEDIPEGMDQIVIPEGLYVVFTYVGKPSEAQAFFNYIYGSWLPGSNYLLDNRPHFALMGSGYKGEDPDSKEEFWIPVKTKM